MVDMVSRQLAAGPAAARSCWTRRSREVRELNGGELTDDVAVVLLERTRQPGRRGRGPAGCRRRRSPAAGPARSRRRCRSAAAVVRAVRAVAAGAAAAAAAAAAARPAASAGRTSTM